MKFTLHLPLFLLALAFGGCALEPPEPESGADGLLRELVEIPSVTANVPEVNRAVSVLRAWLERRGVFCAVESDAEGRQVLWGATHPGKEQDVVLVCHLDVVPAPEKMFRLTERDGRLFGRGVSDCKGNAVVCANVLADLAGKASVGCVFTTDEETGGRTTGLMIARGYRPRKGVVVPDIAGFGIVYAHKGHAFLRLVAHGKKGHSSKPWAGDNALERLMKGCADVRAAWDAAYPPASAEDQWHDTLSITMAGSSSKVANAIPDRAEAQASLRCTEPDGEAKAVAFIRKASGLDVEVVYGSRPVVSDPGDPFLVGICETMRRVWQDPAIRPQRMCGATDAHHFAALGLPIVLVGSESGGAHADDEWCEADGLERLKRALEEFLYN